MEIAIFGTESALNGALNRAFDVGNLLIGTGEKTVNNFAGAYACRSAFNRGLLTGTGQQVFNGGHVGGLVGSFDQSPMAGADFLGLLAARQAGSFPRTIRRAIPDRAQHWPFSEYAQSR